MQQTRDGPTFRKGVKERTRATLIWSTSTMLRIN